MDDDQHTRAAAAADDAAETDSAEAPRRFADSYGLVLVLLLVTYFACAMVADRTANGVPWGKALVVVILAATTWLALRASVVQRPLLRVAEALIPLATLFAVIFVFTGQAKSAVDVTTALTLLLVVVAPLAIAGRIARHPVVSADTFYGAVCVYLLLAMFFATLYALMAAVTGHAFFVQLSHAGTTTIDYLYFSLTTITTVGYGDLTAAGSVGRMAAVLEAVLGQLYLITVVALVVQNLSRKRSGRWKDG